MYISGGVAPWLALVFFASFQAQVQAQAGLGGIESSITSDQKALQGRKVKVTSKKNYTVHEITLTGRVVREYMLADGTIFAVSWSGIAQPDLSVLLGNYYKEYEDASTRLRTVKRGGSHTVQSENIIVEKSGHMRDVQGRAYIPDKMPSGFLPGEIR